MQLALDDHITLTQNLMVVSQTSKETPQLVLAQIVVAR